MRKSVKIAAVAAALFLALGAVVFVYANQQNATLSDVQGTVVSEFRSMLILDTGTGQVRVLLPKFWSIDNGVVGRATLFNSSFAMPGDNVTIGVLKSDVFANQNFSINVMVGYEETNETGYQANEGLRL